MTILQVMAAGFAFGIAGNVSLWLVNSLNGLLNAWVAAMRNRQALELERHKFVCPDCCVVTETRACHGCSKLFMPGSNGRIPFTIRPPE